MNTVVDEVLAGSPRYTIKDNGGTTLYDNVQIDLKTQVTTAGTPLNKALFDSIQTDLNSRLLVSNKATTAEAQAGTNDTKYMTPLKVQQKLNSNVSSAINQSGAGTYTICTFANYTNAKIIKIRGQIHYGSDKTRLIFNGSSVDGFNSHSVFNGSSVLTLRCANNNNLQGFEFTIDLVSKSITGTYVSDENGYADVFSGAFSSLTTFQIQQYGSSSSLSASIQTNS